MENNSFNGVMKLFTEDIKSVLDKIDGLSKSNINEIRMRMGKPLTVVHSGKEYGVSLNGRLTDIRKSGITVTKQHIEALIYRAFQNSVYSFKKELTSGYITVESGCRIGFCGTAVLNPSDNYKIESIRNISSVNLRIAKEIKGCADEIISSVLSRKVQGLLIAGAPSSGKTTVLRDIARQLGSRYRISLIDERNELSASVNGIPQNDVGLLTDVFSSYGRFEAIMTAVRVMSPQIIICDEIGSEEDVRAMNYAVNSGVKIIASCHAQSLEEINSKPAVVRLIEMGAFKYGVLLSEERRLSAVSKLGGEKCLSLQAV